MFRIEKMAHRAVHRVGADRLAHRFILNRDHKFREGFAPAGVHVDDGVADFIALRGRGRHAVEG